MKKYDIAIVISDLGSGGTQRVLTRLVEFWIEQNKSLVVITLSSAENDFFVLPCAVDRFSLSEISHSSNFIMGAYANIRRIFKLRKLLNQLKPQITIGFICTTNILTIVATRGINTRLIISERNDPQRQSFGWIWDQLRKKVYRYADIVTANSKGAFYSLTSYVPREKLRFVPNPLLITEENESIQFEKPTILAVGRLHHQKAYDILLSAFSVFLKKFNDWQLVIIGDGPLRHELKDQTKTLDIESNVKWYGLVTNPFPYYRAARMFVLPSRHEGTPNVLLEAMSCRLPAIVTDASSGPLEYVTHNETGLVVPVEDIENLVKAMSQLATDETLCQYIVDNAERQLKKNSAENVVCIWNSILASL